MVCWKVLAVAGLTVNMLGVWIVFQFGMPTRIDMGGKGMILLQGHDEAQARAERRHKRLGYVGLAMMLIGTGLQGWAVLIG